MRVAEQLGDRHLAAYGHWELMRSFSLRGDAPGALEHAQQTEANRADWWEVAGQDFLAEAADLTWSATWRLPPSTWSARRA